MAMPEVFEYGGYGVNCKLTRMDPEDKDVAWVRGNSFVVVANKERGQFTLPNGDRVDLVSINGMGEIRWQVRSYDVVNALQYAAKGELKADWDCAMHLLAVKHLGLNVWLEG